MLEPTYNILREGRGKAVKAPRLFLQWTSKKRPKIEAPMETKKTKEERKKD